MHKAHRAKDDLGSRSVNFLIRPNGHQNLVLVSPLCFPVHLMNYIPNVENFQIN